MPEYIRQGLKVVLAVWQAINDRHLSLISAGVAFYTIFALFPAMAATIAIWGFFADPTVVQKNLDLIRNFLPPDVFDILQTEMNTLLATNVGGFGWATFLTLAVSFYSIHSGVAALVRGLNAVQRDGRPELGGSPLKSLVMTFAMIGLILAGLTTVLVAPVILNFVDIGKVSEILIFILPWAVLFSVIVLLVGLFYRWAPNARARRRRPGWFTSGAFLAAFLWASASLAFSAYLANFGSYNRIYGSIGAVIALLMWLYISIYIVLLGAVVNAERDRLNDQ